MKNKRVESPARSSITISKCHIQVIERFSLVSDGPQSREIYRFCLKDVNRISFYFVNVHTPCSGLNKILRKLLIFS